MEEEFLSYVKDILDDVDFLKLKAYRHHYNTSRYQHCVNAAYACFLWAKKCKKIHLREISRAALLHDFFLYDWRECDYKKDLGILQGFHAFYHPFIALEEAEKRFKLCELEKDIIKSHMFPCYFGIPKYKESWMLIMVDKYCSLQEGLFRKNFCSEYVF